ncbi:hypothetical protein OJAV_G00060910 [Oryzias javanicus]|uniref:Uncharacterized protein n=1 Tax=Oryzias javanicus TaxID=123683 RepID=A0A437DBM3_ORYJA|nr:hypothetical protein OJAV_G00060910 [Oryzias javanicus]
MATACFAFLRAVNTQLGTARLSVLVFRFLLVSFHSEMSLHHADGSSLQCSSPGNPVFSCLTAALKDLELKDAPNPMSVLYRTSSRAYGLLPPTVESAPCSHHPKAQKFSEHLSKTGMYRNNSFNTSLDRSRVFDGPNLQHTV